jgi:uncharacterized membrane protein YphA (DoxX/SURF4 family)
MVALVARLVLAAVFAVAGIAKLADGDGARRALRAFQVPEPLVAGLAIFLPLAELATAGLLVPAATARWGAAAAVALLAVFSLAITTALARRRQPDCGCCGRLHSSPASPRSLVRNGALAALALVVLTQPVLSGWRVAAVGGCVALAGLTLGHAAFSWQLLRQNGRLWQRLNELERRVHAGVSA